MSSPAMIEKKCKRCKQPMRVRLADHKRGWGKFCSKSCKAKEQTRRTGVSGPVPTRRGRPFGPPREGIFRNGKRVLCHYCSAPAINGVVSGFLADTPIDPIHGVPIIWGCALHHDTEHPFE